MGVELNGLKIGMSVSEYKKKFPGTICYYGRNCDILDQRMTGKLNTLAGQPVVRISVDFKDEQKILVIQYMLGCGAPLSQVQGYLVGLLGDPRYKDEVNKLWTWQTENEVLKVQPGDPESKLFPHCHRVTLFDKEHYLNWGR